MHKLLCAVLLGLMAVSCAQNQRAKPASSTVGAAASSVGANDPANKAPGR